MKSPAKCPVLFFMLLGVTRALYADCSASQNSGLCNSGGALPAFAAAALAQSDTTAGPKILNLDPAIEITNPPGSEVTISNVKLAIDSEKISAATYTVRNKSKKALVAYSAGLDFYWDISPNKPLHASSTEDGWFLNGAALKPGEEEQVHFMSGLAPAQPMHLLRIVISVEYAQFADGSIVGQNAAPFAAKFDESRRIKLDIQHQFASRLKSGESPASVAEKYYRICGTTSIIRRSTPRSYNCASL